MRPGTPATIVAVVGGVVTVVHLGAKLADVGWLSEVTQVLLMMFVALWLWLRTTPDVDAAGQRSRRPRLVRLALVALFFSWLGDSAPRVLDGDVAFLAMVGFFLVAQVFYIVALWPLRSRSAVARAPWTAVLYLAVLVAVVAACAGEAGPLLPAVVVYAGALATMSVLAWGLGPLAGVGGVIFLVSDAMIALGAFAPAFALPQQGFLVMATYVTAQVLLVVAIVRHVNAGVAGRTSQTIAPAHG